MTADEHVILTAEDGVALSAAIDWIGDYFKNEEADGSYLVKALLPGSTGYRWMARAREHLKARLDAYLRDRPRGGGSAQALAQMMIVEFEKQIAALEEAAATLKSVPKPSAASRAWQAAQDGRQFLQRLTGRPTTA